MNKSVMNEETKDKLIDEVYEEINRDINKDVREICYEALKAYIKFRTMITIFSSEKAFNEVHEITMDTSVDVSNAIIKSYREFKNDQK